MGPEGYVAIKINKKSYKLHRVAWLIYYGEDPQDLEIDHINRDKSDNRVSNLRLVDRSTNCFNTGISKVNTSGTKGVSYCKRDKLWIAKIRRKCIGYFRTKEEAITARITAQR